MSVDVLLFALVDAILEDGVNEAWRLNRHELQRALEARLGARRALWWRAAGRNAM